MFLLRSCRSGIEIARAGTLTASFLVGRANVDGLTCGPGVITSIGIENCGQMIMTTTRNATTRTRTGGEKDHASARAPCDGFDFFDEFFGGVPFDAPCTLGALLKCDKPLSPAAVVRNKIWLQSDHPSHFFKEHDRAPAESPHNAEALRGEETLPASPEGGDDTTGTPKRSSSNSHSGPHGCEATEAEDKENVPEDVECPGKGFQEAGEGQEGTEGINSCSRDTGSTTAVGGAVTVEKGEIASGWRPMKRRRAAGGVLAPPSSFVAQFGPTSNSAKDPMQKKLDEYRQRQNGSAERKSASASAQAPSVRATGPSVSTASTATMGCIETRHGVASSAVKNVASRAGRSGLAGGRPGHRVGGKSGAGGTAQNMSRATFKRGRSEQEAGVKVGAVGKVDKAMYAKGATGRTTNASMNRGATSHGLAGAGNTVAKPVRTVKRKVPNSATHLLASTATQSEKRKARVTPSSGNRARSGMERPRGIEVATAAARGVERGIFEAKTRRGPSTDVGGPASGRPNRRLTATSSRTRREDTPFIFDEGLEARLAAHNQTVIKKKGKHTYEPAASLKDWKMWEERTGKKYMDLKVPERADANREIVEMLASSRRKE